MRAWIGSCVIAALTVLPALVPVAANASSASGNVTVQYFITPSVKFTLTPNYNSGYGPIPATFGTPPAPTPGAGACFQGCAVDFGTVMAGSTYLYKYAAHINVHTNDTSGYNLYAEGAADITDSHGNTIPIAQSLFYLASGATTDPNTGFSSGLPFMATSATVNPPTPDINTAPTVTYASYPAPLFSTAIAGTSDYYQDYQFKVPYTAVSGGFTYFVWIVYTVIAK